MRSLGFKAQQTNPKKENKVQGESVEPPISAQFWLQARDAEREREREREREEMVGGTGGYEDEKR